MSTTKRLWLFDPKDDRILSIDEVSKLPVSERAAIVDRSMRAMKADLDNLKVALDNSIKRGGNPDFDHGLLRSIKDHEIALLHYDTLKRTGNYNIEGTPNNGFLFTVDLPDHKFFLDWDKPLREKSPEVQAGLKAISKIQEDATFDPTLIPSADDLYGPRGPTGGTLYRILASRLGHSLEPESGLYGRQGGKEAASKLLGEWRAR